MMKSIFSAWVLKSPTLLATPFFNDFCYSLFYLHFPFCLFSKCCSRFTPLRSPILKRYHQIKASSRFPQAKTILAPQQFLSIPDFQRLFVSPCLFRPFSMFTIQWDHKPERSIQWVLISRCCLSLSVILFQSLSCIILLAKYLHFHS